MPNGFTDYDGAALAVWVKRCYLAGRVAMEAVLRPYDLGATQWYVLYQLSIHGPTMQRDLLRALEVERATLSVVVTTLVRKGVVEQVADKVDQRQKLIRMTPAGAKLWDELPDLALIHKVAFDGIDGAAVAAAVDVLRTATERLENFKSKEETT